MSLKEFNHDFGQPSSDNVSSVQKPAKKTNAAAIVLGLLLAGSLGGNAYQYFDKQKATDTISHLNVNLDNTQKAKAQLQTEYEKLKVEFEDAQSDITKKDQALSQQETEINEKKQQIQEILGNEKATKADLSKAQTLINSLKTDITDYKTQIASLKKENKKLTNQRDSIQVASTNFQNQLTQEKESNKQKEEVLASTFSVSNYKLTGIKVKSSGKEVETDKARRVNKLRVTFDLDPNVKISSGAKDIYIAVYKPDGSLGQFAGANSGTLNLYSGRTVNYSDKVTVNYTQGTTQNVSFDWQDHDFLPGDYKFDIFQNGNKIGQKILTLR